jgi:aldehyde dehydrogenase (NAD+)
MSNPNQNFIAGEWLAGVGEIDNVNPSDLSDTIGRYAQADDAQLQRALDAAETAQREWAKAGLERRYNVLMAIGNELIARCEELGTLLAREEGKTQPEGKGEVYRSGQFFTYYAAEALRQIGDNADSVRDGIEVDVRREPVGTVAVISPWNFPMATAVWKIAPALAFGNAVIWKPANLVPASAVVLAEIISRQDIPAGLFNLVMGSGSGVGQKLVESPQVNAISFTGSVPASRRPRLAISPRYSSKWVPRTRSRSWTTPIWTSRLPARSMALSAVPGKSAPRRRAWSCTRTFMITSSKNWLRALPTWWSGMRSRRAPRSARWRARPS